MESCTTSRIQNPDIPRAGRGQGAGRSGTGERRSGAPRKQLTVCFFPRHRRKRFLTSLRGHGQTNSHGGTKKTVDDWFIRRAIRKRSFLFLAADQWTGAFLSLQALFMQGMCGKKGLHGHTNRRSVGQKTGTKSGRRPANHLVINRPSIADEPVIVFPESVYILFNAFARASEESSRTEVFCTLGVENQRSCHVCATPPRLRPVPLRLATPPPSAAAMHCATPRQWSIRVLDCICLPNTIYDTIIPPKKHPGHFVFRNLKPIIIITKGRVLDTQSRPTVLARPADRPSPTRPAMPGRNWPGFGSAQYRLAQELFMLLGSAN